MRFEDLMPAIKTALDTTSVTTLLGGQHNIFPVYADLPTVFPAIGLHLEERRSEPRPSYNTFKYRDSECELTIFIQTKTSGRDARLIKSAIDNILFGTGIAGTRNWRIIGQYDNTLNNEKLAGVVYYLQTVYTFEYTATDT